MVVLIDADILVYEAAHLAQKDGLDWDGDGFASPEASFPEARNILEAAFEGIVQATEADTMILALTDSRREINFRRGVWPAYKAHRDPTKDGKGKDRPILFSALRQFMRDNYVVKQKPGIEGDDTLGIMATMGIECTIASVDKDLDTVPGLHYNWRKSDQGVYEVTPAEAVYNHMYQTLCGDSTDGFPGCPTIGPKRAKVVLEGALEGYEDWPKPAAMWREVVEAYAKKDLTEDDAIVQARCAFILQSSHWDFKNERPILWTPPKEDS